ncbi:MAG: hypothetical protein WAW80_04095 [Candidatus Saccharimonadales bacterium]
MTDHKATSQYRVTCKGSSSQIYVDGDTASEDNPEHVNLHLAGPATFSKNLEDYTAQYKGADLKVLKIEGKVLTVQF